MTVTILLATRNGARFLPRQLESYGEQTLADWRVLASDDGSDDATPAILERFRRDNPGRVRLVQGPRTGAADNFLSLIRQAPEADHTAFSDQDDLWLPGKIARAAALLSDPPADRPALYASRVTICDAGLRPAGLSPAPTRPPGFRNALVQNILYGHSIVLNRAATALLRQAAGRGPRVVMHDWWAYQIVTGAGGRIVFDDESHVLYRQHGGNQIGAGPDVTGRLTRLRARRQAGWMTATLAALTQAADLLSPDHRALLDRIAQARAGGRAAFAAACLREGLYRQGPGGRLAPALAALAGRL
ncbi:glycosyltransferase family 2 protein [Paracoccus sediminis]|uniref:Glycosyl transferase family 2 n=1 Tax=Paracoccus sediminis TaxID=1214787 RepID=A0A238Y722_9RHOB|nr:glycosyltransferase family 2 protein [Paracoccus sediminis]SNR66384.1 Glycosyl transferase family 2 [Paracoccus sediminis]